MREALRFSGPLKRATVSFEGGRWFVSLMVETDDMQPIAQPEAVVGVDLGVAALATLSSGEVIAGPKSHIAALNRLRLAGDVARRISGRQKAVGAAPCSYRNIRRDATHKLTTWLTRTYCTIGIEDLNARHGAGWRVRSGMSAS
jgi:putative transposase